MKKLLSLILVLAMLASMMAIPVGAAESDYSLVADTVVLDGTNPGTVEVKWITSAGGPFYTVQATWDAHESEDEYFTLTNLSSTSIGTFDSIVGAFTQDNNVSTGAVYYSDAGFAGYYTLPAGAAVWTATYSVDPNTPAGDYQIGLHIEVVTGGTSGTTDENDIDLTAKITVEEAKETAPYEIYYILDKTDSDDDAYAEYDADTVTAEIWMVSNNADVTVQAYDIYLEYANELSYDKETMAGAAYAANSESVALMGDTVTHIQLVKDSGTTISLDKSTPVSLGTVVFNIDVTNVSDGGTLPITIKVAADTENTAKAKDVTNFAIGATVGDATSYYPVDTSALDGVELATYTVTYADGVDDAEIPVPDAQTKYYGKNLTLSSTEPQRDGYRFTGWSDGTNTYPAGASYTGNADLTLTAQWKLDEYTVTWYNADGNKIYDTNVQNGNTISFNDTDYNKPSKAEDNQYTYEFKGWRTTQTSDLDAEVVDLTTYKITEKTDFYPVFKIATTKTYNVYWYNGEALLETDSGDTAVVYNGQPSYNGSEPSMTGDVQYSYKFKGWTTTPNPSYDASVVTLTDYNVTGETKFYAVFTQTVNKYKVTFSTTYGTAPAEQTVEYGNKANKPEDLTAEHYTFDGWYTDDTYATAYDFENTTITGDTTIYAEWTPKTYTVTFNANGGSGEMESQSFTYGVAQTLTANGFTAPTGKTFDGWKDGEGTTYTDKQSISLTGNITLNAQWSSNNYTISADENVQNGTVKPEKSSANYGDTIKVNVNPADGYEIDTVTYTLENGEAVTVSAVDGTYSFTMPDSNVTVSATFKAIDLTVKVDTVTNGTVNIESGETDVTEKTDAHVGDTITLNVTPNTGYKVKSVTYIKTGDDTATAENATAGANGTYTFTMPAYGVTVNVEFEAISYTIAFDGNGATSGSMNSITNVKYGEEQKLTDNSFTKSGYKFLGWSDDKDATTAKYNDGATVSNQTTTDGATVTLYAIWDEATFSVTLNTNDGEYAEGYTAPTTYTYGTSLTLPTADNITKTGYDFDGWYDDENLTGEAVTTIGNEEYGAKEYWAKWTPAEYTITYDSNGGSEVAEGSYTYGEGLTNLPTPTKPGYELDGWYDGETKVESITDTDIGDKTLTAQWTAIPYTITFELEGGTLETDASNRMTYTIESNDTLPTAEKQYYTFAGWKVTTAGGNWEKDTVITAGTAVTNHYGDVTLTAQWNRAATPVVEQYKYAYTGYWMLRVDASNVAEGQEYQFNSASMYYIEDENYAVAGSAKVFYTLIPEEYVENNALTDEGYNLLKIADCDARSTITYAGDINGDNVVNIADANIVYQMIVNGGGYYSDEQLNVAQRLGADMSKESASTVGVHRGTIGDVNAIVNIINGVS